ncbi:ThiS family protein [Colletotrichum truncatum]|uniref:ThiS family protein n=1 Tax=Colletotrichum truncatum TaxID=5467 RepID=A0ACC3Z3V9_COLTU|nr:ThiS family protein [Colletotrichum truncatum]KAF6795614.1 ThiS family protein [Colletotrichum truncatum]
MSSVPRPPKDHFNVLFFASAGSFTSKEHEAFPAPLSLKKLFDILEERYSGFKEKILESCLVTVNLEYVDIPGPDDGDGPEIQAGDEVAIIPPVSSG